MADNPRKHIVSDLDRETIMKISAKAKKLRTEMGFSYEQFALHAQINRNTYFKFEKSSLTGDNFTIAVLARVIRGLDHTFSSFFSDIK